MTSSIRAQTQDTDILELTTDVIRSIEERRYEAFKNMTTHDMRHYLAMELAECTVWDSELGWTKEKHETIDNRATN